ncbi:hypothetical protein HYT26_04880 [Candidatus Pacearchaeota archaeon]|nr:hypothetical protein [Candidatus Pacearchaeota archaeon]
MPIIIGLISFLAPFVIVNIIVWKKKDMSHSIKVIHTIATAVVCLSFTGIVLGSAILCGG